ncbi:LamG-like jellyroll fold domain-containing protein [Aquisphaera insulae]|uniref:LamG-like jellyroll fold domain-containing protein n=1 Tax=Aquisphaera insulae TaxID=2712864 RepID=UPI0013ECC7ED|nr:LamG-like jellyroll fold domain-containing protein [Aquisphaera insulae]
MNGHRQIGWCCAVGLLAIAIATGVAAAEKTPPLKDRTLVVWATLGDLQQRGGGVFGLADPAERFDAITFGEITPGKWMAGSDFFRRTPQDQSGWAAETAGPDETLQLAIVIQGHQSRFYRNGTLLTANDFKDEQTYGDDLAAVIGLRHPSSAADGEGAGFFHGSVSEARLYDRPLDAATIARLKAGRDDDGPPPLGRWIFRDGKAIETTGHFPYLKLHGGARVEGDRLLLNGEDASLISRRHLPPPTYRSPIHYRPEVGRLADTIPFYHEGKYHVFYLRALSKVPWEHIVSTDLIHWTELPTALKSDGPADGPDGLHMFTGSVVQGGGKFHIFYTGWNDRNPAGQEFLRHATSPDLVTWTKDPKFLFGPDGALYSKARQRDFRDPYVWRNADDGKYWMAFCSTGKTGVATSPDLETWTLQPPLLSDYKDMGTPECPDLFKIRDTYYLIMSPTATASTFARSSRTLRGPYLDPVSPALDTRILYAAKRMDAHGRHVLVGWIRDLAGNRDDGAEQWGGTMCVPRELIPGPDGQLHSQPAHEALAPFQKTVLSLAGRPGGTGHGWLYSGPALAADPILDPHAMIDFDVPDHFLLQATAQLDSRADFSLIFRAQDEESQGYHLALHPASQEAEIRGQGFRYARKIRLDTSRPVTITAFVQGTIIECFINDAYAFSCRAYNHPKGRLRIVASGGSARVLDLAVKTTGD